MSCILVFVSCLKVFLKVLPPITGGERPDRQGYGDTAHPCPRADASAGHLGEGLVPEQGCVCPGPRDCAPWR